MAASPTLSSQTSVLSRIRASSLDSRQLCRRSVCTADIRALISWTLPIAPRSALCFAFFGFGCQGRYYPPPHSWLPKAHPEAPSNGSALMSGGTIKIGIFGIPAWVSTCWCLGRSGMVGHHRASLWRGLSRSPALPSALQDNTDIAARWPITR